MSIQERARALQDELVRHRRHLHRHPEPSYREEETAAYLSEEMRTLGYEVRERQGGFGAVADLVREPGEEFVLLRADMDSLPIAEESGEPFSSENEGHAHLCGHDAHCAMVWGAAKILAEAESETKSNYRIVFQSAEEIPPGGAAELIGCGVLDNVKRAYALHVDPRQPTGVFSTRSGPMTAAVNEFKIWIRGRGGHAAYPHLAADPIVVAARLVTSLQEIVSRKISPFTPGVVSVCQVRAGETFNVLPEEAFLRGTTRFYTTDLVKKAREWIREIARGSCAGTECSFDLEMEDGYPPLVNDPGAVSTVQRIVSSTWGEDRYIEADLQGGGEDFSRYLETVPGAMIFIGINNPEIGASHFLHSPHFKLDEDCLWRGAALLASMALAD